MKTSFRLIVFVLLSISFGFTQTSTGGSEMNNKGKYVEVNGLTMYYEMHGTAEGEPLVLLHGAFSAIGTSFGEMLPGLAKTRQVIAFELQGHGRTADIDRPLRYETMADDVAAAIKQLGYEKADLFGYSMGSMVALQIALRHPETVRKLVLASGTYNLDGIHPGLMDGLGEMKPDMMYGSPWHEEYTRIAPRPEDFDRLFAKKTEMDQHTPHVSAEEIQGVSAPTLLVIGDSDLTRPEHAVEWFRLLGGGVFGDMPPGLPNSQLAILPGTTHVTVLNRAAWLVPMVDEFLNKPLSENE
jgi:pimeloyl-ACP methyl ester carboxylesterase